MINKIGFIAGCFDGPEGCHEGHKYLLKCAKEYCDYLIVAINYDVYIRTQKNREPLAGQYKRREALYNTGLVDEVVYFNSDPLLLIQYFRPDFVFCGSDYKVSQVIGHEEIKKWGGEVKIIERLPNISTTEIIEGEK